MSGDLRRSLVSDAAMMTQSLDWHDIVWSLLLGAVIAELIIAVRLATASAWFWLVFAEWRWRQGCRIRRFLRRR
ncbi:ABC-type nitrate/sulfonate/bicarbonate transport system permease component [Actinoalloteichus hymeniacidonis]|uniref:Uncharacterized protein n=1 Tax=Actinoalloteichus hymeniacidonis TaxID=340345 RepID=A0AAC9HNV8_9PSEU|nr:hypothetical protein TL08_10160 [Actinoalloteichus hymeniacidonis]MBB5909120.1 ABC-type nitrate/sulfonate/bicarbonate transport system permease component [Actinoalloteichus hymeniacidonis]